MDDRQFRQLLDFHRYSWDGYRKVRKGVKKRVRRHMQALGCNKMDAYLAALSALPEQSRHCQLLMAVPISRFMRDLPLWRELEQRFLPELAGLFPETLRIWSAGCACGEEVYSFKIVWHRFSQQCDHPPELEVLATDINPENLERAVAGTYPLSSLKEVPASMRNDYFQSLKGGRRYRVNPLLKAGIQWERQRFPDALPQKSFHMIFLRNNVLTYYREEKRERALAAISDLLACRGLLVIGANEPLAHEKVGLAATGHPNVFRRTNRPLGQVCDLG